MKVRRTVSILLCLLAAVVAWLFWPRGGRTTAEQNGSAAHAPLAAAKSSATASNILAAAAGKLSAAATNRLTFRLTNTPESIGELKGDRHAILLENAFIDTTARMNLKIPSHLQAKGEPGAYIVQARGAVDGAFRAALAGAGGKIISYIPNNAFLVEVTASGAAALSANALVQVVLPYEPYYKVQSSLLGLAVNQKPLPPGTYLTLGLFDDTAAATVAQIEKLGGKVLSQDRSPFGQIVHIIPPTDWIALANLPGVQRVEPSHLRVLANDLSRPTLGITADSVTTTNYLNLSGSNVLVEMNDTGVDANQPDLIGRVLIDGISKYADNGVSGVDTSGHGTFVAGVIAGDGTESLTVTNASGSINPGTNGQYRGKAPLAKLYSVGFRGANDTNVSYSDSDLQEIPALTNALISNNSWVNGGDNEYDLAAASYDAAVRDALPHVTGPQPVLFVFAAGDDGGGISDGSSGVADTIESPATAKDVITVGALEQNRNITNQVTPLGTTNSSPIWAPETDSSFEVADYSARGNVGVDTEGTYGRFKPDVVAPGTFVISTRSTEWDELAFYNPTNYHPASLTGQLVTTNILAYGGVTVPQNAVGVVIRVVPNAQSPVPFPGNMPIYVSATGVPDPTDPTTYDFMTSNDVVNIPPDGGGGYLATILNGGVSFAVGDGTNIPVNFDVLMQVITTNDLGNELEVLSNLNDSISAPPYYYRYESGTSVSAPAVSGVLALMQDFFTNTLHLTPSPALLKAMLINGARVAGNYNYAVADTMNLQGWGLVKLPNSIPLTLTNTAVGLTNTMFFMDQSPTNVLSTGDRRTYLVSVPTDAAQALPLRVTLAWTDPPGNPAAAIKLVNDLELVVTNLANGQVYYANNFTTSGTPPYSVPSPTNAPPAYDSINNVQNIYIAPTLGTNYSVSVVGNAVNVNAVTAEQTNIVQDFALVISSGDGSNTNGISVTATTPALAPAIAPLVTYVSPTNAIYFNQTAGADAPWLMTNSIALGASTNLLFATNALFFVGQTNQWHFYIVTNTFAITNPAYQYAAFITFLPNTLAIPREGVFAGSDANSTRPEADLELFAATAPDSNAAALTNLNMGVISNCLYNVANTDEASYGRGGTEFVTFSNSVGNQVYYIAVQCNDQTAGQFGFVPLFSATPFSSQDTNGNVYVNAVNVPANIPDGNNAHPGVNYVFALAIPQDPAMVVRKVTVTNTVTHQNFGDLVGSLSHNSAYAVLNNHDGLGPVVNDALVYDDSGEGDVPAALHTDGPGSLNAFQGAQAAGLWLLNEVDDSPGSIGTVENLQLRLEPHRNLNNNLITVSVPPGGWYYDYIDVPVGYTNLLVVATNLAPNSVPPIQIYLKPGSEPTLADTNDRVLLTNCPVGTYPTGIDPGNSISTGPPLTPGRYFIGLYNPDTVAHSVVLGAILSFNSSAVTTVDYDSTDTPLPLLDDAVTLDPLTLENSTIFVTNRDMIQGLNVGLRVDHPRISDMVFTLISPDGTRYLLMENRGGQSTNGCGATIVTTNIFNVSANGNGLPNTNVFNTGMTSGTFPITYNFYTAPDEMTVYYGTTISSNTLVFDTGFTNNPGSGLNTQPETLTVTYPPPGVPATSTYLTIIMNQFGNPGGPNGTQWTYSAGGVVTNYEYLAFTENTNLTTTPIKFASPPFVFTSYTLATNAAASPNISTNNGWVQWLAANGGNNHWYKAVLNTNGINWSGADASAHSVGGYLATITSQAENDFVFNLIDTPAFFTGSGFNGSGPAIGGINTNQGIIAIDWKWETGETWGYTSWKTGLPNNPTPATLHYFSGIQGMPAETWDDFDANDPNMGGYVIEYDSFSTNFSYGNLYYQPEQSLSPLNHTSAYGEWQLEALDNRAGATNPIPELLSWQLEFTYAYTNFTIPTNTLVNGLIITNYAPGNSMTWYEIDVPTNAIAQTNTLLFATLPLNIWFSTNQPPGTNSPGGTEEQTNSMFGVAILYTNSVPLPMVPGGTNYLGVQNPNQFTATYAISVNFELINLIGQSPPFASSLPATGVTGTNAQLNGFATPNNTNGLTTTAWFQWGATTNYGNLTPPVDVGSGFGVVYVTNSISSLIFAQIYHCRLVVSNSLGVAYGMDEQFAPGSIVAWGSNSFNQTNAPIGVSNAVAVAGGWANSVALLNNGTVTNWGDNTYGQVSGMPVGLSNVMAIAAGGNNVLALLNNGTVVGWGANTGQANIPIGLSNVVEIAAGWSNSLALLTNGTVVAWGDNTYGQTNVPAGLSNVVAIASGGNDCLALLNNGTVIDWGDNTYGQTIVPAVSNLVAIAGGGYHNLALQKNGNVLAWGDNTYGQTNIPIGLSNVEAIAAGLDDSLALLSNGHIVAWGDNSLGQTNVPPGLTNAFAIACGAYHNLALAPEPPVYPPYASTLPATSVTGTTAQLNGFATPNGRPAIAWFQWGTSVNYANQSVPVVVGSGNNVVYVTNPISGLIQGQTYHFQLVVSNSVGIAHGFDQLLVSGSTVAWGSNAFGQTNVPPGLSNVVSIAAGGYHSLEITNGKVLAWGENNNGQTNVPTSLSNAVMVAGGTYHSLALQSNGLVTAWGNNTYGETAVPSSVSNVVEIAAGGYASLVLENNGQVAAWGDNTYGQTNVPAALNNVVSVAEGGGHSLALLNDGTVVAWGTNTYGQATVPAGLNKVVAVAAGKYHSLALLNKGTVVAWGYNNDGQATVPAGLSNVVAVAAGGYHSLALLNNGKLVVWGDDSLGQTNVPSSASNVVAVAAGDYHSLALTSPYNVNLNLVNYPTNDLPLTNVVGASGINWFQINVPTNAIASTNALIFATLPVNFWFSTNVPPSITQPGDIELQTNSTGGTNVFYSAGGAPLLVPGGTYYLGVQNTNSVTVTNAIQVTFEYVPPMLPFIPDQVVVAGDTLIVTNTVLNNFAGDLMTYVLENPPIGPPPAEPQIDANGIITWTPSTNIAPTNVVITTIVTDTFTLLSATNSFNVSVLPPVVINQPQTNTVGSNSIVWYKINVPTNAVAATNTLLFATLPVNVWWSTNVPPTVTQPTDFLMLPNSTGNAYVLDTNTAAPAFMLPGKTYYVGVQNLNAVPVTFAIKVTFRLIFPYTAAPYATTMPATRVNGASAQLNGMATANGDPATAWFEWGQNTGYGSNTLPVNIGSKLNVVYVTNVITGLITNQDFHFRLVVSNALGVTYGFDQVFAQGSVVAWGADFFGQTTPIPPGLTNLVAGVGAGFDFSLALNYDGSVVAWGDDSLGQTNVPAGLNNAVAVAGGYSHSLALRSDRTVTVWGDNTDGQTNVPSNLNNAVAVASGSYHCLALRDNGIVTGWGLDSSGQTNIPVGLTNVVAVAAGYSHSLALKNDGTVVAWGNNAQGETNVPANLTNVVAIAAGYYDSLALRSDGTVVAWGYNANGQTNVPASLTNVTAIAAGGYHCLALKGDGSVWFWGDSSSGQLNFYPTNLANVFTIAGGGFHTVSVSAPFALNVTNTPPYWTNGLNGSTVIMDEQTTLSITNAAADRESPPQLVFYSFLTNPPSWASLDSFTGIIKLTPHEADGPTTNLITTVATDNGFPPLSATNSFTVVVNEVNTPPFWPTNVPSQTHYFIPISAPFTVTNTASDSDIPTNVLTYTMSVSPNVTGAAISTNGIITWTPQVTGSFTFTTVVTDTNPYALFNQSLSATNQFTVTVTNLMTPPTVTITSLTATNIGGKFGFLLTWYAPSNDLFLVQWTPSLAPANWTTFTNIVSYNTNFFTSPTNTQFNYFDDGTQTGGFGPARYYRLVLLGTVQASNTPPVLPPQTTRIINPQQTLVVTNTATDADIPTNTLTYALSSTVTGTNVPTINTNTGVITWTPTLAQAGTSNVITTIVTDNGVPPLSATNSFTVIVNPVSSVGSFTITSLTATNIAGNFGFLLTWYAPSNDLFLVQWTPSLAPANWTTFTNIVSYNTNFFTSPTNTQFNYFDDGTQTGGFGPARYYRLVLLGTVQASNTPPVLPPQTTRIINPQQTLVVTNTATDADIPTNTLTYALSSTVTGTNVPTINTNTGVITWTPTLAQAGTSNVITTIVTDNGVPPLSATNSFTVIVNPVSSVGSFTITSLTATNIAGNFGFLLTWYAPSNDLFLVQWTPSLAPANWTTFTNIVSYNTNFFTSPTNTQFNYFDDGTQTGGFGPARYYRLILLGSVQASNTLTLSPQTNFIAGITSTINVTNMAVDSRANAVLTYNLLNPPANTGISTNGVITWTNASPAGLAARFITVVTDDSVPSLTASNSFTIFVAPLPSITNVTVTATNVVLSWSAPTNDLFQVRWSTNLAPQVVWTPFANFIASTNSSFSFTDTNAPLLMKFYQLILLP